MAEEDRKWEHAFEQLSHLWSTPRFLFLPFAIGMGEAALEDKLVPSAALSEDSSLRVCRTLPCVGGPLAKVSEADPREAEIWWAGGGDEERDKEASESAAAVAGLQLVSKGGKEKGWDIRRAVGSVSGVAEPPPCLTSGGETPVMLYTLTR